jgi:hypothetical protein
MRSALRILIGKFEGKRELGRSSRRWEVHIKIIKMDLKEVDVRVWTRLS